MTDFEKVMSGLTALYVFVTGFYAYTSFKTLRAIEKQGQDNASQFTQQIAEAVKTANAAKASADAATLNAKAVISSERAWIEGTVAEESFRLFGNPATVPRFWLRIENSGRTPGRIERVLMMFEKRGTLDDLPPEPYFHILCIANISHYVSTEDKTFKISRNIDGDAPLTEAEVTAIRERKLFLLVYGVIEYTDILDNIHESGFCFIYAYGSPISHGFQTCFEVPESYRKRT